MYLNTPPQKRNDNVLHGFLLRVLSPVLLFSDSCTTEFLDVLKLYRFLSYSVRFVFLHGSNFNGVRVSLEPLHTKVTMGTDESGRHGEVRV